MNLNNDSWLLIWSDGLGAASLHLHRFARLYGLRQPYGKILPYQSNQPPVSRWICADKGFGGGYERTRPPKGASKFHDRSIQPQA
jgi:hypothetical protein